MKNIECKLMMSVTKAVIKQYIDKLSKTIDFYEETLDKEVNVYEYDVYVTKAKEYLNNVKNIYKNFNKSVFDGVITEREIRFYLYKNGIREEITMEKDPNKTPEEVQINLTILGINRILEQLLIDKNFIGQILLCLLEQFTNQTNVNQNTSLSYGNIFINDALSSNMTVSQNDKKKFPILAMSIKEQPRAYDFKKPLTITTKDIVNEIEILLKEKFWDIADISIEPIDIVKERLILNSFATLCNMLTESISKENTEEYNYIKELKETIIAKMELTNNKYKRHM